LSGGLYYFSKTNSPKPNATQVLAPSSSPTDETANWKTYTNPNKDFSFKYPFDFKTYGEVLNDIKQDIIGNSHIRYSPDSTIKFENGGIEQKTGIEIGSVLYGPGEDIENYKSNSIMDNSITSSMTLPTDSKAEVYLSTKEELSITTIIYYKKNSIDMRVMIWCSGDNARCKELLVKVLSTFKLTDQQTLDTSDWKIYTNSQLMFSLKYPSDITYKENQQASADGVYVNVPNSVQFNISKSCGTGLPENSLLTITSSDMPSEVFDAGIKTKKVKVGDYEALETVDPIPGLLSSYQIGIKQDEKYYTFSGEPCFTDIVRNILGTFKFTN